MQRQRHCYPLILLDAAVVMSIQKNHVGVLVQRILLQIQTGRVDMRSQNIHTILNRFRTDLEQNQRLIHADAVNTVALFQRLACFHDIFHAAITLRLCKTHRLCYTLTLCLGNTQICLVIIAHLIQFCALFLGIA